MFFVYFLVKQQQQKKKSSDSGGSDTSCELEVVSRDDALRIVEIGDDVTRPEVNVMVVDDAENSSEGQLIEIIDTSPRDDVVTATVATSAATSPEDVGPLDVDDTPSISSQRSTADVSSFASAQAYDDDVFSKFPPDGVIKSKPPGSTTNVPSFVGLVRDVLPSYTPKQPLPQELQKDEKDKQVIVGTSAAGDWQWVGNRQAVLAGRPEPLSQRQVVDLNWSTVSEWWCGWFDAAWLPYTVLAVLMTWVAAATEAEPALVVLLVMFATLLFLAICPPPQTPSSSSSLSSVSAAEQQRSQI